MVVAGRGCGGDDPAGSMCVDARPDTCRESPAIGSTGRKLEDTPQEPCSAALPRFAQNTNTIPGKRPFGTCRVALNGMGGIHGTWSPSYLLVLDFRGSVGASVRHPRFERKRFCLASAGTRPCLRFVHKMEYVTPPKLRFSTRLVSFITHYKFPEDRHSSMMPKVEYPAPCPDRAATATWGRGASCS